MVLEIINADSMQVYRGMDFGTGKDFADYMVDGKLIPYHLIDIVDPGYEYNVFEFVGHGFLHVYDLRQCSVDNMLIFLPVLLQHQK